MSTDDAAYYRKRAGEEREKAAICEDNLVALAHLRMADEYDRRVRDLIAEPSLSQPAV
jgi:hypothetical protein